MKVTIALTLCFLLLVVDALPAHLEPRCIFWFCTPQKTKSTGSKKVDCHEIAKYSTKWFIRNASKAKKPKPKTCLFYTSKLAKTAQDYAKNKAKLPKKTIWEVWPGGYYNKNATTNNPLRCIMQKETEQAKYFRNMSKAFASLCDVSATVMDSGITRKTKTFNTVKKTGVWYKTEFPTLKVGYNKNKVDLINAISPDGKTTFRYWTREGVAATGADDDETTKEDGADSADDIFGDADADTDTLGEVLNGEGDVEEYDRDDLYPEWWEEDGVLDNKDLEDWELDST